MYCKGQDKPKKMRKMSVKIFSNLDCRLLRCNHYILKIEKEKRNGLLGMGGFRLTCSSNLGFAGQPSPTVERTKSPLFDKKKVWPRFKDCDKMSIKYIPVYLERGKPLF